MIRRPACLVAMTGALVTFLAVAVPASAATRYAEPNGNGPEPCDLSDPCSLQTAVEGTVTDGDEVILLPGTYVETDELDDVNDAIDLHGQSGSPRPTIMSSANTVLFSNDPGTVIHHLDIEASGVISGLFLQGGTVDEVTVHETTNGTACTFPGAAGATIRDTVCWNSGPGPGVGLNQSSGTAAVKLRNVTAVSSGSTNSFGVLLGASNNANVSIDGRAVIAQGVTADIRASEDATASSTINLDTSNYFTVTLAGVGTPTVTPAGSGTNQTAEPLFVDTATGGFHQAAGSPTIDAGGLDGFSGSIDIDGDPRTLGAAPDIGADEFVPAQLPAGSAPPASSPTGQRAAAIKKCKKKAKQKHWTKKRLKKCKRKAKLLPV